MRGSLDCWVCRSRARSLVSGTIVLPIFFTPGTAAKAIGEVVVSNGVFDAAGYRVFFDLDRPWSPGLSQGAFQCSPIPSTEIRRRLVGALQELHERALGVRRRAHRVIRQDEFAQLLGKEGLCGEDGGGGKALGRRIGVGIERRISHWPAARPEPGTRHLMRIGFASDRIRQ